VQLWEGVALAIEQIRTEKLKSFFSLLGVVIGVMFLILVVSVVEGMDRYIRDDFSEQVNGLNTVTVRRTAQEFGDEGRRPTEAELRERIRRPNLTYEEFEVIRDNVRLPGARVGVLGGYRGTVVADNGNEAFGVQALAVSEEVFDIRGWVVERGRPVSPQEGEAGAAVVILGVQTAEVLFEGAEPLGRTIRLRGVPFRVIGILEEQGSVFGQSLDNWLIGPFKSPMLDRNGPRAPVGEIVVQVDDPALVPDAEAEVEGILRAHRGLRPGAESDFAVDTADETISAWDTISRVLFTALPGLVTISLVVGGIVIMNIMLVSVMERTREIGIRKAVGARRRDILLQVVVEATTLSAIGSVCGVALGIGIVAILAATTPLPAAIDALWITVGVLLGVFVGVVAGVYPAVRASAMHPVDALRYE
jgi:putative ABC transport system permease protein